MSRPGTPPQAPTGPANPRPIQPQPPTKAPASLRQRARRRRILDPVIIALCGVGITVGLVVAALGPMMVLDGSAYLALITIGLLVTLLLIPAPKRRRSA